MYKKTHSVRAIITYLYSLSLWLYVCSVSKEKSLGLKVNKYIGDKNIIKQTLYRVLKCFVITLWTEFPNFLLTHLHLRRWKFSICEAYLVWGINFSVNINYRMLLKVFCNHCYPLIRSLNFLSCFSVRIYNNKHNGFQWYCPKFLG